MRDRTITKMHFNLHINLHFNEGKKYLTPLKTCFSANARGQTRLVVLHTSQGGFVPLLSADLQVMNDFTESEHERCLNVPRTASMPS